MLFQAGHIEYKQTNKFSKIVLDYLEQASTISSFCAHPPTLQGLKESVLQKEKQVINRKVLAEQLQKQYSAVDITEAVSNNIQLLASPKTFTVCTAHQPNLFTGPLYFIYKILHTIKLAAYLQREMSDYHFVPVYYMGSEDADFAELNHTYVSGKKIEWQKVQTGAVGRMQVDAQLVQLIDELEGQLSVQPYGHEVIALLRRAYAKGRDIQTATFDIVNELYGKYGLVVLIPDNPAFKQQMLAVFEDDIFRQTPSSIVEETSKRIEQHYNAQAHPRQINLFYLKDDIRERIIREDDRFTVHNTSLSFTGEEIRRELQAHPERFSPNVILRGLFQETVLPNIAFIGGGGELAYWLQLKDLFHHYRINFPVLILRNSFLVLEKQWRQICHKHEIGLGEMFSSEVDILNAIIERQGKKPQLNGELKKVEEIYEQLNGLAAGVDATLSKHVAALRTKTLKRLEGLEKKMQRAERKKNEAAANQVHRMKEALFPQNGLQERVENFSSLYAKWGSRFIDELYLNSLPLQQQFTVLQESL